MLVADVWYPYVAPLRITAISMGDRGGSVSIDEFGQQLLYTPAAGFEGIETFTYTIETADGLTDTATVTVRVGAVPEMTLPEVTPLGVTLAEVTLATTLAGPATERETAPTELASPGQPLRAGRPPASAFAVGYVARSGAVFRARHRVFSTAPAHANESLDAINLSHLASNRRGPVESQTDRAFAGLSAAGPESDDLAENAWDSVAETLLCSAEI